MVSYEDDDSRMTRALEEMSERCEELERRVSMLEDEWEDDDDEDEDGEVDFLGDIEDDEDDEVQRSLESAVLDAIDDSEGDILHDHDDVVRELGGGR